MADLRIVDAPEIPTENITGQEKLPTGGSGNYSITLDSVADYTKTKKDLVDNTSVDGKVNGVRQELGAHIEDLLNPHQVTKGQIGLGNVDNTADADKPVSNSTQSAIISAVAPKADKNYVDNQLTLKANKADVYTKQESNDLVNNSISTALTPINTSLDLAKRGVVNRYDSSLTYNSGERVVLTNGDTVKSTVDGNANDPNVDMTGWVIDNKALIKLNTQFVSVWDFFTDSEKQAYNLAILNGTSTSYDSYRPLKEFFDYIAANDVGTAYCSGTFYTSNGLVFGGASGSKTKQVVGDFHICAINGSTIHTLLLMQCGKELTWLGSIHVQGLGGLIFSARTVRRGLVLGGEYQCAHTYINSVNADDGFSEYGVLIDNLTTASNIEAIRVTRCGSGMINPSVGETSSWTNKTSFTVYSENTSSGIQQETVISVTKLPPTDLKYNPILKIGGELYHVKNVDHANSQLTIFPILNRNNTDTNARYIYGAGVAVAGSDASVCRIGKINSTNCGVVYHSGALYPAVVGAITAESNTINILLGGNTTTQAHVGGAINSLYCEASEYDIVRRTRAQLSMTIVTNFALNLDKLYDLSRTRAPVSNTLDTASVGFDGVQIAYNGKWLTWENRAQGSNNVTSIDVTDVNRSEYWHSGSSKTFNIAAPNPAINNQFGYNRKSCVVTGINNAGNPTGDIVFNAPTGYTVNGSSSVTFNGFTQAAKFDVYLQFSRNNFVVVCLTLPPTSAPSASVIYDPPSLAAAGTAGDSVTTTVTLTGVTLGSVVQAAFSQYNDGVEISAQVSAANTVTVKFKNTGASTVDLASGTLMVKLL